MDARRLSAAFLAAALVVVAPIVSFGASYRTINFVVKAPTADLAEKVGRFAEQYRHDLAVDWLGEAMPNWSQPCPIHVQCEPTLGAGGKTSFVFYQGEVFGWQMEIQGNEQRLLDSVLPHEVTHTIFASHFRRPLPRWADEGACTTVEDISERSKQDRMLISFLRTGRGIAFSQMFVMTEYPADILPLYSQGYSLARFLIVQGGRRAFLAFLKEGMESGHWSETLDREYGYKNLAALQNSWLEWVKLGCPEHVGLAQRGRPAAAPGQETPPLLVQARGTNRGTPLVAVHNVGGNAMVARGQTAAPQPQSWPVRNGSVAIAESPTAPEASSVPPPPAAAIPASNDPAPPAGKSVYGDGVGLIHRSTDAQSAPPKPTAGDNQAASTSPPAAIPPLSPSVPEPHSAGKAPDVLLQWNR